MAGKKKALRQALRRKEAAARRKPAAGQKLAARGTRRAVARYKEVARQNEGRGGRKAATRAPGSSSVPRRILVLDVGGSHVKLRIGKRGTPQRFASGPKMSAAKMVKGVRKWVKPDQYDAVSMGYPGLVFRGRIAAEPYNLGRGWAGFDFEKALGRPVRIINDAAMQALGSYVGGRMLFIGLGTGMGATLILDGIIEPMELGHLPYKRGRTYEEFIGERGLKRLGKKKWRKAVDEVVTQLGAAFEVDYMVLGGGNARLLKKLPKRARLGGNDNAMIGGDLLWRTRRSPLPWGRTSDAHGAQRRGMDGIASTPRNVAEGSN
ncbi:MAG TPA: ROK family protein [Steroidobacteraceae bacterium]|nr:ROK family protein [Steroidobacteraceae bacterium]